MSARPNEIVRNNVKEKLARGEVVASMTATESAKQVHRWRRDEAMSS